MAKVFLCGFMGAGKTHTAELLAKEYNYEFIDLDAVVKEKEKKRIYDIFNELGEDYFRMLETKYLKEIVEKDNIVCALGGGTVLADENVDAIKDGGGIIVFLDTDLSDILTRIKEENKRPLLKSQGEDYAIELYFERLPIYRRVCDFSVEKQNLEKIKKNLGIKVDAKD